MHKAMQGRDPNPKRRHKLSVLLPLEHGDWHEAQGGAKGFFRCAGLSVSGVEFVSVKHGAEALSPEMYYSRHRDRIHWKGGTPPPSGLVVEARYPRHRASLRELALAVLLGLLAGCYFMSRYAGLIERAEHEIRAAVQIDSLPAMAFVLSR
jgi:hypothetical protein